MGKWIVTGTWHVEADSEDEAIKEAQELGWDWAECEAEEKARRSD